MRGIENDAGKRIMAASPGKNAVSAASQVTSENPCVGGSIPPLTTTRNGRISLGIRLFLFLGFSFQVFCWTRCFGAISNVTVQPRVQSLIAVRAIFSCSIALERPFVPLPYLAL